MCYYIIGDDMNFYRNREFFINRVYNYFELATSTTYINNTTKKRVYLTGNFDKTRVLMYLIFCFFFILIGSDILFKSKIIGIYAYIIGIIIFLISSILVIIKTYKLHKKLIPKSTNINIYERDLPSNLRPAHVRFLMTDGLADELSLASTLLDLVDRDYLKLEYQTETKEELKSSLFKNKDIVLIRTNKPIDDLFEYEKYLINWFLGYNDGISITSEKLHNSLILDTTDDNEFPSDKMNFFSSLVLMSFPLEKYYNKIKRDKNMMKYVVFVFLGFMPMLSYIGEFLSIYGLGVLLFANPSYTFNREGINLLSSYKNLKKYLEEFSLIENKNAQMVEIWNYYLTYSISLDINSVASNELKDFFGTGIFKGAHNTKKRYNSTKEDAIELQKTLKEWNSLFVKERLNELKKYNN